MGSTTWRIVLAAPNGTLLQTLAEHFKPILAHVPSGPELLTVQTPEQLPPDMGHSQVFLMADGPAAAMAHWRDWLNQRQWPYQVLYGSGAEGETQLAHALAADERLNGVAGLQAREEKAPRWRGVCERCADPACEHRLFSQLRAR